MNTQTQQIISNYFIDTHCHLNLLVNPEFNVPLREEDLESAQKYINQAQQNNVQIIINIGTGIIDTQNCIALAKRYQNLFVVAGLHPNDLTSNWQKEFAELEKLVKNKTENKIVGIGETGIDLYRTKEKLNLQIDSFKAHIELALAHDLAIIVHTRAAAQETLTVLEEYKNNLSHCIIHCYPYDIDFARTVTEFGCYLGVGGPITYPNNKQLPAVVQAISLEHIVLETDAPYLPPQHMRGQKNTPAQISVIAQEVARIKKISITVVAQQTTANAKKIFNTSDPF